MTSNMAAIRGLTGVVIYLTGTPEWRECLVIHEYMDGLNITGQKLEVAPGQYWNGRTLVGGGGCPDRHFASVPEASGFSIALSLCWGSYGRKPIYKTIPYRFSSVKVNESRVLISILGTYTFFSQRRHQDSADPLKEGGHPKNMEKGLQPTWQRLHEYQDQSECCDRRRRVSVAGSSSPPPPLTIVVRCFQSGQGPYIHKFCYKVISKNFFFF